MNLSRADWARHLGEWRGGGETARRYCAEHGLKLGSLRYWSGRIRRETGDALNAAFEVAAIEASSPPTAPAASSRARFVKVRRRELAGPNGESRPVPLRLLVNEVQVEVPTGFDAGTLRRVLEVLRPTGGGR